MDRVTWRGAVAILGLSLALGCERASEEEAELDPTRLNPALVRPTEEITAAVIGRILPDPQGEHALRTRYLNLMKLSLADLLYQDDQVSRRKLVEGWGWPNRAYTMIGLRRLTNIEQCFQHVIENDVPGDLIEAGAWRGGATILMRALLEAYDVRDRVVWVADSFEGLPPPDPEKYPADAGLDLSNEEELAVSLEEVQRNFARYQLLDDQVRFLKGWFKDTLPDAPIEKLAILRLDADLYESTMDAIVHLYPKLSKGGCLIVDDYFIPACRKAISDYRLDHGIFEKLRKIDDQSVYWIKQQ